MGFYHELLNFHKAAGGERLSVTPELEYGDAMVISPLDSIEQQRSSTWLSIWYDPVAVW